MGGSNQAGWGSLDGRPEVHCCHYPQSLKSTGAEEGTFVTDYCARCHAHTPVVPVASGKPIANEKPFSCIQLQSFGSWPKLSPRAPCVQRSYKN